MELKILRGPSGRILTIAMKKNGTLTKLKEMFNWCKDEAYLLVYCYENNIEQPKCNHCNSGLNSPHNTYCNSSCQMYDLGGFPKGVNAGRIPWNKGLKDNSKHCSITNPEKWALAKEKIGLANSGKNNGMYGWDDADQRARQSATMKSKILNGEFTPNTNNRNTSFDVVYKNKNYRSSWEAAFASINPSFKHEFIRIQYIDESLKSRIYISDFFDEENKIVFEIRPKSLYDETSNKISSAIKYCKENGYKYKHIDIDYFYKNNDKIDYDGLGGAARKIKDAIKKYKRNRKT